MISCLALLEVGASFALRVVALNDKPRAVYVVMPAVIFAGKFQPDSALDPSVQRMADWTDNAHATVYTPEANSPRPGRPGANAKIGRFGILSAMEVSRHTYTLSIEKHPDGYLAYFPALPGCHTWGKTYEDAVKYAEDALAGYLNALIAHGDKIPEETDTAAPVSLGVTVRTSVVA